MSDILPIAMRPSTLDEVLGQSEIVKMLKESFAAGKRASRAYMFHGPSGCGKTTLARIVALMQQCSHENSPCKQCWANYHTFAIHEKNASETNGVDDAAQLAEISRMAPLPPSKKRVLILDEAQMLTTQAQNLLLKPTEDIPAKTVWMICTTDPRKIIPTLQRRFTQMPIRPLGSEGRKRLVERAAKYTKYTGATDEFLGLLEEQQVVSPALILMAFEKLTSGVKPQNAVMSIGSSSGSVDAYAICKAVTAGDTRTVLKHLSSAAPEEARLIRASVVGWLRGGLFKGMAGKATRLYAQALVDLNAAYPLDDAAMFAWLTGRLTLLSMDIAKLKTVG